MSDIEPTHDAACRLTHGRLEHVAERRDWCLVPKLGVIADGVDGEIADGGRRTFAEAASEESDDASIAYPTGDLPQSCEHFLMHEQLTSAAISGLQAGDDMVRLADGHPVDGMGDRERSSRDAFNHRSGRIEMQRLASLVRCAGVGAGLAGPSLRRSLG